MSKERAAAYRDTRDEKKDTIFRLAEKCGLSASEYGRQRALGYEPRAVLPDAFSLSAKNSTR